jgi:protein gp37
MAAASHIEWTDATWNPVTGCTLISEGCRNCYAAELAAGRLKHHPSREGLAVRNLDGIAKFTGEVRFNEGWLDQPLRWRKPRRIFVCAHGDLFHESVPDEWIDQVFAVMALAPRHIFQILTKRPDRMREYLVQPDMPDRLGDAFDAVFHHLCGPLERDAKGRRGRPANCPSHLWTSWLRSVPLTEGCPNYPGKEYPPELDMTAPLPNVWLGVSVEDQVTADQRIPDLLTTPAAVRFLSAEPLLGPVDLQSIQRGQWRVDALRGWKTFTGRGGQGSQRTGLWLDWVIAGGESGPNARPCHPDWIRGLRDQCAAAQVSFFFKQWGAWAPYSAPAKAGLHVIGLHSDGEHYRFGAAERLPYAAPGVATMVRVGKAAAGCELDGAVIQQMPVSTHAMRSNPAKASHGPARPPDTDDVAGGLGRGRGTAQIFRGKT